MGLDITGQNGFVSFLFPLHSPMQYRYAFAGGEYRGYLERLLQKTMSE